MENCAVKLCVSNWAKRCWLQAFVKELARVWIMQHPKSELDATVLTTLNLNSYFLVYFMSLHMHEHAADIMWVMNITQHLKSPNLKYSGSQTVVF